MSKRLTPEELEKAAAEGREMREAIQKITREMEAPSDDYERGRRDERARIAQIMREIGDHGIENAKALREIGPGMEPEARAREWSAMRALEMADVLAVEMHYEPLIERLEEIAAMLPAPSKEGG